MAITIIKAKQTRTNATTGAQEEWCLTETYGLSTDTHPTTKVVGGSVFVETDHSTGIVVKIFDEASSSWITQ